MVCNVLLCMLANIIFWIFPMFFHDQMKPATVDTQEAF